MCYNGEGHRFFCMNCGREGVPIFRKAGKEKGKFHRKRLYCPWCKIECNHIEVRNDQEKYEFLQLFQQGEFKNELQVSIAHCKENVL